MYHWQRPEQVLTVARKALKPEGRIIIRTPNMANLLGGYSLHMDITHCHGYTEWSLIHLLDECGLENRNFMLQVRKPFAAVEGMVGS